MQAFERKLVPAVVFDSSIEDEIGQVLALGMLLSYGARREVRVASVSISRYNLKIAAFCEALSRFFGASSTIGMAANGAASNKVPPMLNAVLEQQTAGRPAYMRTIENFNDTADPVALIRNALTAQQDQNAVVILAGPSLNLLGLLALPGSKELVQKKVRALVIAGPLADVQGTSKLLTEWPGPVIFAGEELGRSLRFPAESIEQDFAWATNHPVLEAYRAAGHMPYDASATAMAAVLYAAHPDENYFKLSETGVMQVMEDGRSRFTPDRQGKHQELVAGAAEKGRIVSAYREIVSAKPPEPRRGGRGPQQ